jgi:hypothetical protein
MRAPRIVFTDHARWEAKRRGIPEAIVRKIVREPEQILPVGPGREVRQFLVHFSPEEKAFLVRVIVDVSSREITVVTVYRTSKVEKYRRQS